LEDAPSQLAPPTLLQNPLTRAPRHPQARSKALRDDDESSEASSISQVPREEVRCRRAGPSQEMARSPQSPVSQTNSDLCIEIPVVKPMSWSNVEVEGSAVTFDERGVKETMTVRSDRWSDFVDRQKRKIEKEIQEAKDRSNKRLSQEVDAENADQDVARGSSLVACDSEQDDIEELVQLVERMDDWKDLSRYSGKSISMASTKRGNEMKINVMAFAEREDGGGIDFTRICYKKSVEVDTSVYLDRSSNPGARGFQTTLGFVLPLLGMGNPQESSMERSMRLLQRPDVAKFAIALAFRNALANDGVYLKFCEASFDDAETEIS